MKKVKPAIYSGLFGWGWVDLEELGGVLGLTPHQVWMRYHAAIWFEENNNWCYESGDLRSGTPEFGGTRVFIPAGVSMKILHLHEAGVASVIFRHDVDTLSADCVLVDLDGEAAIIALDAHGKPASIPNRIRKEFS